MPVPTGSSDFLKNKLKITKVCFVRHGSAPRSQELRPFPGGAAPCRGWRGAPGTAPLAAVPSVPSVRPVPPSGPFPATPARPRHRHPAFLQQSLGPGPARDRGKGAAGPQASGNRRRGEGEGSPEGAERGPGGWPGHCPERGPGAERRRPNPPRRSCRVLPVPRGRFGSTGREIPEAGGRAAASGHLSALSARHPASLAGSSRPGRRGVALGITHLKYKSLPFGLEVTNRVGNAARARPQLAMATPEAPKVPTRVGSSP